MWDSQKIPYPHKSLTPSNGVRIGSPNSNTPPQKEKNNKK